MKRARSATAVCSSPTAPLTQPPWATRVTTPTHPVLGTAVHGTWPTNGPPRRPRLPPPPERANQPRGRVPVLAPPPSPLMASGWVTTSRCRHPLCRPSCASASVRCAQPRARAQRRWFAARQRSRVQRSPPAGLSGVPSACCRLVRSGSLVRGLARRRGCVCIASPRTPPAAELKRRVLATAPTVRAKVRPFFKSQTHDVLAAIENGHSVPYEVDGEHETKCARCTLPGELLCCDTCPSVYHLSCLCLSAMEIPAGMWSCPDCVKRQKNKGSSAGCVAVSPRGLPPVVANDAAWPPATRRRLARATKRRRLRR